jgi:xylene monooxygenase electron transfer component|tara:strand:- start:188 stop:523 length:336 start_codon:yes stop_codon:yes gene_type:complete
MHIKMINLFKKKKASHVAKLMPQNVKITIKSGDTLLSSALSQKVIWPHRCKVGSCGSCKYQLLKGEIKPQLDFRYVLEPEEIENGFGLACQTILKSDIEVNIQLTNTQETL